MLRFASFIAILLALVVVLFLIGRSSVERSLLFFPTHKHETNGLTPWMRGKQTMGYARLAKNPQNIWLMLHGNAGQAADRAYAIPCFAKEDSVYIMEYPGYGDRHGYLSRESFDKAAAEAYVWLRETYPKIPICVVGESIGSGPASTLAGQGWPPDRIVLVVPFDRLSSVAKDHFTPWIVDLIMTDDWNNVEALADYKGSLEIYGATNDTVIPVQHARALAKALPRSTIYLIESGHNEWAFPGRVQFRN